MALPVALAPLCAMHNLIKADFWSVPGGELVYHPFDGLDDIRVAWAVLHTEIGWLEQRFDHDEIETEIWSAYGYPSGLGGWNHG